MCNYILKKFCSKQSLRIEEMFIFICHFSSCSEIKSNSTDWWQRRQHFPVKKKSGLAFRNIVIWHLYYTSYKICQVSKMEMKKEGPLYIFSVLWYRVSSLICLFRLWVSWSCISPVHHTVSAFIQNLSYHSLLSIFVASDLWKAGYGQRII